MAVTKDKKPDFITFYIIGLNGEPKTKITPIRYPHAKWSLGRSKDEDTPDETDNVEFVKGRLVLDPDDWKVQWMRAYNDGGTITVDGKSLKIK